MRKASRDWQMAPRAGCSRAPAPAQGAQSGDGRSVDAIRTPAGEIIIEGREREGEAHGRALGDRSLTRERRHAEQTATRERMWPAVAIGLIGRRTTVFMVMRRIVVGHRSVSVHMSGTTVMMRARDVVSLRQSGGSGGTI